MKLKQVDTILLVQSMVVSRQFYTGLLGLEILHDWQTMLVFKERLSILQASELQPQNEIQGFIQSGTGTRSNVVIYLQSDDLETCCQQLTEAGVRFLHGIIALPWERVFRIYDPDGYLIEIGEPH